MFKDLFSNRLFIGALAIFIFCVVGGLLYMQHVQRIEAEKLAETQARVRQWNEKQKPITTGSQAETPQGHFHSDGTFRAEPHDAPVVEVSESEVSPPVLAAPVAAEQADTELDAATLESVARRLKNTDVSKAWVEWLKKNKELSEEFFQAAREDTALLPTTEEELVLFNNDPEWQRRRNEALHKTAEIYTRLKAHEKENPLLQ